MSDVIEAIASHYPKRVTLADQRAFDLRLMTPADYDRSFASTSRRTA